MSVFFRGKGGFMQSLFRLCDRYGAKLRNTSASEEPFAELRQSSFFFSHFDSNRRKARIQNLKRNVAAACESSVLLRFFRSLLRRLMRLNTRAIASLLGSYLISSALVSLSQFALGMGIPSLAYFVSFAILSCLTITFLMSDTDLFRLLNGSGFFGGFLQFVHPSDALKDAPTAGGAYGFLFACGLVLGAWTWFLDILWLPILLVLFLLLALFLSFPEAGFLLVAAGSPFFAYLSRPSVTLAASVSIVLIGFLFKLFRGKRISRRPPEFHLFVLWSAGILLSGFSPFSGSAAAALLTFVLMLGYPLALNLLHSEKLLLGVSTALTASAAVISAAGIVQVILGQAPGGWLDPALYGAIGARAVSVFENPNVLGVFLVISFPFSLALLFSRSGRIYRFFGAVCAVLILVCSVLTWSRCAWIGLLCGAFFFALRLTPRAVLLLPASALLTGSACVCFPKTFGARLLHIFSLTDSANAYRVGIWNGVMNALKDHFFCGIGAGDDAFRAVFLQYAVSGTEAAPHAHSIYLQMALSCGILPLLLFLLFSFSLLKNAVRKTAGRPRSDACLACAAGFASVVSLLICGIFDHVFYNYRILFLFCCVAGICSAAAEVCSEQTGMVENSPMSAELRIHIL